MQYSPELVQPPLLLAKAIEQHQPKLEVRLAMSYEYELSIADLMAYHLWRWN